MNRRSLVFETYPPMFEDYEKLVENEEYDDTLREFVVPCDWAVRWIEENFGMTLEEFNASLTWDDTNAMYCDAGTDAVIVTERIVYRD